jgi:hypothetical protein
MLRDSDIRAVLRDHLRVVYAGDGDTEIVDELSVCRAGARADLAVINGHLAGFEIKSDVDRLDRLPSQALYYGKVFDEMTLVCAPRHLDAARRGLPDWWELWVVEPRTNGARLQCVRRGAPNPEPSRFARAQLLWREDMVELLIGRGRHEVVRWPRRRLIPALLDALEPGELDAEIRRRLRRRAQLVRATGSAAASPPA